MRSSRLFLAGLLVCVGCRSLPSETETVDLTSKGIAASIDLPKGSFVRERVMRGAIDIDWGDLDGTISVSPVDAATPALSCPSDDTTCKVVESDASSVLYTGTYQRKPKHFGLVNVTIGGSKLRCEARSRDLDNARRLFAACKTAKDSGGVVPTAAKASPSMPASAATSAPAVETEKQTFKDKGTSYALRAPKGWESQTTPAGGRMFLDPAAKTSPADAVTIRISPTPPVKTLANAEAEVRRADLAGLDTIADKKALSAKTFEVSTAPRGTAQLMTVNVIANGKKNALWADCHGPAKRRALLEEVCGSLEVE